MLSTIRLINIHVKLRFNTAKHSYRLFFQHIIRIRHVHHERKVLKHMTTGYFCTRLEDILSSSNCSPNSQPTFHIKASTNSN